jgi:hypothetical protein
MMQGMGAMPPQGLLGGTNAAGGVGVHPALAGLLSGGGAPGMQTNNMAGIHPALAGLFGGGMQRSY